MKEDDFIDELDEYIGRKMSVKILPKMTSFEIEACKKVLEQMLFKLRGNRIILYDRVSSGRTAINLCSVNKIDKLTYGSRLLNAYTISFELLHDDYSIFLTIKE